MNSDLEHRLRTSLRVSANRIDASPDLGGRMVQLGHEVRRRRRTMVSLSAAALVAVLISGVVLFVSGPFGSIQPVTTTTPPSNSPSGTPSPSPSPTASATPPPPTVWPRGVSILDAGGTIHDADGSERSVPVPATTPATRVTEVVGGWVVDVNDSASPLASRTTSFLTADGNLRSFDRPAPFQYAFSPDRTRMVALTDATITVFELPSLNVVGTVDATGQPFGQPTGLWLRGDRIIVQHVGMGDGGGPTGVVVWDLNTGDRTESPGVMLGDVSADGRTAVLQRWDVGGRAGCLAVVPFTDHLVAEGEAFCDADGHDLTVSPGSVSPDGQWVAVSTTSLEVQAGGVHFSDVVVYRVSEILAGAAQPAGYRDQFPEDGHAHHAGWVSGNRVVIYEERLHWVLVCLAATGECQEVELPASARSVVG